MFFFCIKTSPLFCQWKRGRIASWKSWRIPVFGCESTGRGKSRLTGYNKHSKCQYTWGEQFIMCQLEITQNRCINTKWTMASTRRVNSSNNDINCTLSVIFSTAEVTTSNFAFSLRNSVISLREVYRQTKFCCGLCTVETRVNRFGLRKSPKCYKKA